MPALKISATLPTITTDEVPDIAALARHLEDLGFESAGAADLIIGDGTPAFDATVVLAAAASVTRTLGLEFGVLTLPLRPVALVAAQVATLQHLSGNRVILGVGLGGLPGSPFWRAAGAPMNDRGRVTDRALETLPGLIKGETVEINGESVVLAPAATVPPIVIGGNSEAAMRRAATYGDGWLPSLISPEDLAGKASTLRALAAEAGRPVPSIAVGGHALLVQNDAAHEGFVRNLMEWHGMDRHEAERIPITGGPSQVADRLAAYAEAGADRAMLGFDGGDWRREAELLAVARALLT